MRRILLLLLILAAIITHAAVVLSAPLTVHPTNPRYLIDGNGKLVYLAGSHVWFNVNEDDAGVIPSATDFNNFLDWIQSYGHNHTRLWTALDDRALYRFNRPGPETIWDGCLKFDLTSVNSSYLSTVRSRVQAVLARGMTCSVMLFGTLIDLHQGNWNFYSWHPSNNINNVSFSPTDFQTFFSPNAADKDLQRGQLRAFIDALHDLDNVIFEIANEGGSWSRTWQEEMVDYAKQYELATYGTQHLYGITGGYDFGPVMLQGDADWFSPDQGTSPWLTTYWRTTLPVASEGRPCILDTDHLYEWGEVSEAEAPDVEVWVWKAFTRGYNPIFMEAITTQSYSPFTNPYHEGIRKRLGQTVRYAAKMDLANSTPTSDVAECSTTFLLRYSGNKYLAYQPTAGASFTVNISAGYYYYEWFDPTTGAINSTGTFTHAPSGNKTFAPPPSIGGAAVLYLTITSTEETPPGACRGTPIFRTR